MITESQKHMLIEMVKKEMKPTELERDIIDTMEEMSKQSLDVNRAQARIAQNYRKHPDLYAKITALPTTSCKDVYQITEVDLRYILQMQQNFLLEKEWEEIYYG